MVWPPAWALKVIDFIGPRIPTNDDFNRLFLQIEKIIEEEVEKLVEVAAEKEL